MEPNTAADEPAPVEEQGSPTWPLIALLVVSALILVALQFRRQAPPNSEYVGRPLPQLDAAGWINSPPLTPSELRGKLVLIDFWATWCAPCHEALPDLIKLKDHYRDRGLTVIGLSPETESDIVKKYVASVPGMDWPVAYGAFLAVDQMNVEGFPTYILFDESGRAVWGGYDLVSAEEAIVAALQQPK